MTDGPDVIDLLTDSSSLGASSSPRASQTAAAATPLVRGDSSTQTYQTPQQFTVDLLSPDTPDLPSPSAILHTDRFAATPTQQPEQLCSSPQLIRRNPVLDIPSSPPLADDYDIAELQRDQLRNSSELDSQKFLGLPPPLDPGEFALRELEDEELEGTSFLDEIIRGTYAIDRQQIVGSDELGLALRSSNLMRAPRTLASDASESVAPTEILDSESDSDSGDAYFARISRSLRQATEGNVRAGAALLNRRSASMQHTVVEINGESSSMIGTGSRVMPSSSPILSPRRPPVIRSSQNLATSSSLDLPSSPGPAADHGLTGMRSMSQVLTRREGERERKRLEREERKRLREEQEALRRQERQYEKSLDRANRKGVDAAEVAKDMVVLADKSVLELLASPPKSKAQTESGLASSHGSSVSRDGLEEQEHGLFADLKEAGIAYRVSDVGAKGAFKWEMCMRRKWDSLMGMYVPLAVPRTVSVRLAAMVVWPSERLVDLVSRSQLADAVEVERGLLGVRRLFVVVVGLAKFINRVQTAESREFARLMRQRLKDSSTHPVQPRQTAAPQTTVSEDDVDEAVLQIQATNPQVTWFLQCKDASAFSRLLCQTSLDMALSVFRSKGQDEWMSADSSDPVAASTFFTSSQPSVSSSFITSEVRSALRAAVIRTGADLTDSWIRALVTIPKVTQAVAQCIVAQYPTPRCLFDAWGQRSTVAERAQMLANLTVSGGRKLGITMSTRIFHMFTESNPSKPYAEC